MTYEPPQDLVALKRDFFLVDAGLSGRYDFDAAMQRLQDLTSLIHDHPWWATVDNAFKARMALIRAAKATLPEGFPQVLPDKMPGPASS